MNSNSVLSLWINCNLVFFDSLFSLIFLKKSLSCRLFIRRVGSPTPFSSCPPGLPLFQKINHFPGMAEICRKDLLARNLNRMLKLFPKEYCIFPRTWCLPAE